MIALPPSPHPASGAFESALCTQAAVLSQLFDRLSVTALSSPSESPAFERTLRLILRLQSQYLRTLRQIAQLRKPPPKPSLKKRPSSPIPEPPFTPSNDSIPDTPVALSSAPPPLPLNLPDPAPLPPAPSPAPAVPTRPIPEYLLTRKEREALYAQRAAEASAAVPQPAACPP